jgi:hypothetical protein
MPSKLGIFLVEHKFHIVLGCDSDTWRKKTEQLQIRKYKRTIKAYLHEF